MILMTPSVTSQNLKIDQVKPVTYDVISNPLHGHKMLQLRNATNVRQSFGGKENF